MNVYYKVKPGSPTWKRVLEFEEKRDRVFEIQKKVLTKLGIATYKRFGGVFYSMNVLPVTFTSEEAKVGWKKVRGENHYKLDTKSPSTSASRPNSKRFRRCTNTNYPRLWVSKRRYSPPVLLTITRPRRWSCALTSAGSAT